MALLIFLWVMVCALPLAAIAQTAPIVISAGNAPVVRVMMRGGSLRVRTWSRTDVKADSQQPITARSFRPEAVANALQGSIPIFATTILLPDGPILLPPEELSLSSVPRGPHSAVVVQADEANLLLTIPAGTVLLLANVSRGAIDVQNYRGGTFALLLHNGAIHLRNVSGSGYAQVARGAFVAENSSFDHLRARSALGTILFENCDSRQIQVTNVAGTTIYDNGSFKPGLARFETGSGDVAIGVAGGDVQLGAHSSVGRIYSSLRNANVRPGQTDFQTGRSNTLVTASSERGGVYLYNGALRSQRSLPPDWAPIARFVRTKAARIRVQITH